MRLGLKIVTGIVFLGSFQAVKAQDCDAMLRMRIDDYQLGRFDESISGINTCIESNGYSSASKIVALSYLAKSFLAIDSIDLGNKAIREILERKDNYEAEIDDPIRFKRQLEYVRAQMKTNMIMSVSKKAEKLELAPATIFVITAEDILNRGYKSLDEILDDLPGFDVAKTGGLVDKSFNQRGYRSANMNDKTMIVFDGVEDNEMYTQFAYIGKQLPVQAIKRVEMIYGPASSLYGANAFSGVINVVTKDGADLFEGKKNAFEETQKTQYTLEGRINSGSNNTNALEMDAAVKLRNGIVMQVFGKYHTSDENNLSGFSDWDGKWSEADFGENHYAKRMTTNVTDNNRNFWDSLLSRRDPTGKYYTYNSDTTQIIPTQLALDEIAQKDQQIYNTIPNISGFLDKTADPREFSDKTVGQYLGVKVTLGDLVLQAQLSERDEGASPDYVDRYFAVNSKYTNWEARQQFISSRYTKKLGDRWFFYNTAYYRISDFGNNSRLTTFRGFAQGNLGFADFIGGANPSWGRVSYFQQCKQFRDEFRAQFVINDRNDILFGAEVRNGVFQSNYLTTSTSNNAILAGTVASEKGGNNPAMFDLGAFVNYSYSNPQKFINVSLGGRWDKNVVAESQSAGYSQFNPRASVVYYPGKWVFKAIYSEAIFAFPSFVKFSTSVSRVKPDDLDPEKVRNAELSVFRTFFGNALSFESVVYHTRYSNLLTTRKVDGKDQYGNLENSETRVTGSQFVGKLKFTPNLELNMNATYNHSRLLLLGQGSGGSDSALKTAQVADFTVFAGLGWHFLKKKAYLYVATNIVGNKYTGLGTTIANATDMQIIPGYQLINATLRYHIKPNTSIQLIGRNLLDALYFAPGIRSAAGSQSSLIPQMGRSIDIALNFKF
jgi:outer membrane receptor for ferrienterochelin and colicins